MRKNEIEEMRELRIFAGVAPSHIDSMLQNSFLQRFPAHVELIREGDPADFLHVVVDGNVEVYSAYRDRETTIAVLGHGQCFILAAVVLDRVYLKSARSLVPSRILLLPAEAVRRSFQEDIAFARCLAVDLAMSYRSVVKELKNQKLRTGLERLANWLLSYRAEVGQVDRFDLPFSKKILASRLGITPEALSRSFALLADYKVTVTGPTIHIQDLKALHTLAKPTETIDDAQT